MWDTTQHEIIGSIYESLHLHLTPSLPTWSLGKLWFSLEQILAFSHLALLPSSLKCLINNFMSSIFARLLLLEIYSSTTSPFLDTTPSSHLLLRNSYWDDWSRVENLFESSPYRLILLMPTLILRWRLHILLDYLLLWTQTLMYMRLPHHLGYTKWPMLLLLILHKIRLSSPAPRLR